MPQAAATLTPACSVLERPGPSAPFGVGSSAGSGEVWPDQVTLNFSSSNNGTPDLDTASQSRKKPSSPPRMGGEPHSPLVLTGVATMDTTHGPGTAAQLKSAPLPWASVTTGLLPAI
ncbi:hypothetical protein GCM10010430_46840 [Kitasatospora cystarginea]|uniref:Uncharacterized protein n=1 Tax=Kitasatospora cystarginea TaxID=58350 RepID=A0ABN3EGE3_9ACTN